MNIMIIEPTKTSTTAINDIGTKGKDGAGRSYRFAKAGALALARGKVAVAPTFVGNHTNMSFTSAPAIGARTVTVTLGATAATADQYKDGYLSVQDGTGEGRLYLVEGHAAADASASLLVYLKDSIDTLGVVSEANVDLIANPYSGAVISVVDQADQPVGVPIVAIAAGEYGWLQTGGPCNVLQDEIIATGQLVTIGSSVAGAVEAQDAAGEPIIGVQMLTSVDTEYQAVHLTIDN